MRFNFQSKLFFSFIFVVVISFGFVSFFLDKSLEDNTLREIKSSLLNQAYLIERQIANDVSKIENKDFLQTQVNDLANRSKCRLTIIDDTGRVLADSQKDSASMENHLNRPEVRDALGGRIGEYIRYSSTLKIDMLYLALPVKEKDEAIRVIRLALPLTSIKEALNTVRRAIIFALFFAFSIAFVLGSLLSKSIIKPINRIIYSSRKFSQGDFTHKIHIFSRDELGELALTLNNMAAEIEEKIRETGIQNQQLMAVFNSMIEGVIVVDKASRIISINPTIEKIFSVSKDYSQGKVFLEAIRNSDVNEIISSVLENGIFVSKELNLLWPVAGTFQINASAIYQKNQVSGCLLVIHDITQIRKLETMRTDFVANVSHELKTPLTSIKGFVETLLEGAIEDKENSRHFLKIVQDHTNRLDRLVNDLLDLSYLESKDIKLVIKEVNLKALTEDVLSSFKSQIKKKGVKIANDLPSDLIIRVDPDKIDQVLTNLIDNAIKFNKEKGFIKIYSETLDSQIKITLEDSGIGIPLRDVPRIFERFYRVDKMRSRELGGTGLGLSIVKHIIERHGGSVGVESTEGLGSKFWFILPS